MHKVRNAQCARCAPRNVLCGAASPLIPTSQRSLISCVLLLCPTRPPTAANSLSCVNLSAELAVRVMAKSKGTKRGRKKKRVAVHIKDAAEKRAASAFSGNSGEDQRAQLLASPLGVGRPKRPREPGQLRSASYTAAVGDRAILL